MLLLSNRNVMRILISFAVIMLAMFVAGCDPASDEPSPTQSATVSEGQGSSEPADTPTETPEPLATHEPTSEPTATNEPTLEPTPSPEPNREPTATPDIQYYLDLDLPEGNPLNGKLVAIRNGCRGCHFVEDYADFAIGFAAADGLPAIMERGELRIADPEYTGSATSNLEYIFESIYLPELYVVEGQWMKAMPLTFHYRLTDEQDLADLLAWMAALNDPESENK
jgi:hypothetical protein